MDVLLASPYVCYIDARVCVCVCLCMMPTQAKRGHLVVGVRVVATMWVLGIKQKSCGRATRLLSAEPPLVSIFSFKLAS